MRIGTRIGAFAKDCRGNVAMLFSLTFIGIVGIAGLAFDYGRMTQARSRMAASIDAAVLSAAKMTGVTKKQREDAARATFDANMGDAYGMKNINFTATEIKTSGIVTAVKVAVVADVPLMFGPIFGYSKSRVNVEAEAVVSDSAYVEIAMVLDTTGSMSGSKMTTLKTVAKKMVDDLKAKNSDPEKLKFAVVPFAQYVNVGTSNSGASWLSMPSYGTWNGCVGSRDYPSNVQDDSYGTKVPAITGVSCPTALLPLTKDTTVVKNKIDAMSASGMTYIPGGVMWGLRTLSKKAPFDESREGSGSLPVRRYMILMTDGENTRAPTYPKHNSNSTTLANSLTTEACTAVNSAGITVFAIAFAVTDTTIKTILQDCAGSAGRFYDATDATQLADAFDDIRAIIAALRLTQ